MIITKAELISEARQIANEVNADSRLTNKFLWSIISKHLGWILSRESDKLKLMRFDYLFQTKKCVEVIEAPTIDPCCGLKSKCRIYRTCQKLPEIYEDTDGVIIKSIFSIDGSTDIRLISVKDYQRKLENPDSKYDRTRYAFFNNGYLYFPNQVIKKIMVKALFKEFVVNDCDGEVDKACNHLDSPSGLPPKLRGELMEFVKKDLRDKKGIPPDVSIDKNEVRRQ